MRNSMIDERGAYKTMQFESEKKGVKTIWRLTESQSNGDLMDTLDTFTNGKGTYKTYARREIDEQIELGNIKAV